MFLCLRYKYLIDSLVTGQLGDESRLEYICQHLTFAICILLEGAEIVDVET